MLSTTAQLASRACENLSSFSGTGAVPLDGKAADCCQSFTQAFSAGDRVYYTILSQSDCLNTRTPCQFEVGVGTFDGNQLIRQASDVEAPIAGGLIAFSGGPVQVAATTNPAFWDAICSALGGQTRQSACRFPVGKILPWHAPSFPGSGWLPMDGSTVYSTARYTQLSAVLGASGDTFTLPNLFGGRSRVGSVAGRFNRGQRGGEERTVLDGANIAHDHSMFTNEMRVENLVFTFAPYATANDFVTRAFRGDGVFGITNAASHDLAAAGGAPVRGRTSGPILPSGAASATDGTHNSMHPFAVVDHYLWSGVC